MPRPSVPNLFENNFFATFDELYQPLLCTLGRYKLVETEEKVALAEIIVGLERDFVRQMISDPLKVLKPFEKDYGDYVRALGVLNDLTGLWLAEATVAEARDEIEGISKVVRGEYEKHRLARSVFVLPLEGLEFLCRRYSAAFVSLPVRARNLFSRYSELNAALPLIQGVQTVIAGLAHKSKKQFSDFLAQQRDFLEDYLERYAEKEKEGVSESWCRDCLMAEQFGFLTENDVKTFSAMGGIADPAVALRLMIRYLQSADSRVAEAAKMYYGIGTGTPVEKDEIAAAMGLSRERVRQLLEKGVAIPDELQAVAEVVRGSLPEGVVSSEDSALAVFNDNIMSPTPISVQEIMGVICTIFPEYSIRKITGFPTQYLVPRQWVADISVMETFGAARRILESPSRANREIPAPEALGLSPERYAQIGRIFTEALVQSPDITLSPDGMFHVRRNRFDYGREVVEILREHGSPMTLAEIYSSLEKRLHFTEIPREQSMRGYIYNEEQIVTIGRKSTYALAEWTEVDTTTTTEKIHRLLQASARAMTIPEIVKALEPVVPGVNYNIVNGLILADVKGRFQFPSRGSVGCGGRTYGSEDLPEQLRRPFFYKTPREKFDAYCRFTLEHGHHPLSNTGSKEEESLYGWRFRLSPEDEYQVYLSEFDASHPDIPRNGREVAFAQRCRRILELLGRGDSLKSDRTLYMWYYSTRRNPQLSDYCRRQFRAVEDALVNQK